VGRRRKHRARIESRENRCNRRLCPGRNRYRPDEHGRASSEAIDVRRSVPLISVDTEMVGAQRINKDEKNIRWRILVDRRCDFCMSFGVVKQRETQKPNNKNECGNHPVKSGSREFFAPVHRPQCTIPNTKYRPSILDSDFSSNAPTALFQTPILNGINKNRNDYLPSHDDQKFLINSPWKIQQNFPSPSF